MRRSSYRRPAPAVRYTDGQLRGRLYDRGGSARDRVGEGSAGLCGLCQRSHNFAGKYIKLTSDIDLSSVCGPDIGEGGASVNWTRIGFTYDYHFAGTFDGCGRTISNLYFDGTADGTSNIGLFGYLKSDSEESLVTIKNLKLPDVQLSGCSNIGGVYGIGAAYVDISNCYVSGTISCTNIRVGGIGSSCYGGTIEDCCVVADITCGSSSAGGIVASMGGATIDHCYAAGTIAYADDSTASQAGGIAGRMGDTGVISNCAALQASIKGFETQVGRIVGSTNVSGTVTNSYAYTDMTGITMESGSNNASGINGEDITAAEALTAATYTGLGWSADV